MNIFRIIKYIKEINSKSEIDLHEELECTEIVSNFFITLGEKITIAIRWCYANPIPACIIAIISLTIVITIWLSNRKWSRPMH